MSNKITLAKFRENASHKKCSKCYTIKPSNSFARQKKVCLKCRNERAIDVQAEKREALKKAAGNCWWLKRYFIITDMERLKVNKSYI